MSKDTEAFENWLNEPMIGSSYNSQTRRQFADAYKIDLYDLAWAFASGRNSLRQEQLDEGK